MKKLFLIPFVIIFLISGCASITVKEDATNVLIEVAAFTLGYKGAEKNPDTFADAAYLIDQIEVIQNMTETDLETLLTKVRNSIAKDITHDPLLQYQAEKLLGLVEIDIKLDTETVDIPEIKIEIVKTALEAFMEGVKAQGVFLTR